MHKHEECISIHIVYLLLLPRQLSVWGKTDKLDSYFSKKDVTVLCSGIPFAFLRYFLMCLSEQAHSTLFNISQCAWISCSRPFDMAFMWFKGKLSTSPSSQWPAVISRGKYLKITAKTKHLCSEFRIKKRIWQGFIQFQSGSLCFLFTIFFFLFLILGNYCPSITGGNYRQLCLCFFFFPHRAWPFNFWK